MKKDLEWIWGVTTDDPTLNTANQVYALEKMPRKMTVRTVFDPGLTAAHYAASIKAIHNCADIMGLLVDSSDMKQTDLPTVQKRVLDYITNLNLWVSIWEIGNEVNGNWLGDSPSVVAKIEAMYDSTKMSVKAKTALTLYYGKIPVPGTDMFEWIDQYLPVGHRMRTGLDYVLVSYYEDQNNGYQLTCADIDYIFSGLSNRFPNSKLGFGECGWGNTAPQDPNQRIALYRRFYNYTCPYVPAFIGGNFFWEFRQRMVPPNIDLQALAQIVRAGPGVFL